MAKTRGAAAAAAGTVVHDDPESGKEAVSPVETPGAARAMQTRTATRKSSRRRTPVATGMDNNGEEGRGQGCVRDIRHIRDIPWMIFGGGVAEFPLPLAFIGHCCGLACRDARQFPGPRARRPRDAATDRIDGRDRVVTAVWAECGHGAAGWRRGRSIRLSPVAGTRVR